MKNRIIILLMSLLPSFNIMVSGQQQESDSLKLYLMLAAKNSPVILQSLSQYKAALEKVTQAGTLNDPELNLDYFLSPMEIASGKQIGNISIMQMFPWFGLNKAARDEMSQMAMAEYESLQGVKLKLFYQIRETWYRLYEIKEDILISSKSLEILKTMERITEARLKSGESLVKGDMMNEQAGATPLADLYRIKIEIGGMEDKILTLQTRQRTLIATFNSYINRPSLTDVFVPDTMEAGLLSLTREAMHDTIMKNNPAINIINDRKESLEARGEMIRRMGYPMVGIGVGYSVIGSSKMSSSEMNGKDMIMPMASITLPIYRKKYQAMSRETEYLKSSADYSLETVSNALEVEYYSALQQYEDARRRLTLYSDQISLSHKILSIKLSAFSSAGSGLSDVLQVISATLDLEMSYLKAVTDCNIAIAKMNELMASENL